ncbi:flavin reductase family protein [Streptomyces pratens]|uniref:Flavin reductase family protein n=2 Tax=Streptomyces TaxID=1883 RepID=A0ABW1LRJ7_9ACTN|nr:flavin reductase family protein [Streptomyces hirsutus]WSD09716.1 flavin reductase family protein [Streptomyces hirsutus]WTD78175.1 flavin reductase family protein [Streptomyces sp. NBC_01635]
MNLRPLSADPTELRHAFACFPSGVVAVCGCIEDEPAGMAVSSFTSVSLDPALVSVCVQKTSSTWPFLRDLPRLGISIFAEDQATACRALAGRGDRFRDVGWKRTVEGAIFIDGAAAVFDCSVYQEIDAGDHVIVLLKIEALRADRARLPLVFHHSEMGRLANSHGRTAQGLPLLLVSEGGAALFPPVCS